MLTQDSIATYELIGSTDFCLEKAADSTRGCFCIVMFRAYTASRRCLMESEG